MGLLEVIGSVLALLVALSGWIQVYRQKRAWADSLALESYKVAEKVRERYAKIDEENARIKAVLVEEIKKRMAAEQSPLAGSPEAGTHLPTLDLLDLLRRAKAPPEGPPPPPPGTSGT
mgnify:CR=1 FL=1